VGFLFDFFSRYSIIFGGGEMIDQKKDDFWSIHY